MLSWRGSRLRLRSDRMTSHHIGGVIISDDNVDTKLHEAASSSYFVGNIQSSQFLVCLIVEGSFELTQLTEVSLDSLKSVTRQQPYLQKGL